MKKTMLPFHLAVLLIIIAGSAVTFAVAQAATEYAFIKPYVANIVFAEPNLKVEQVVLNFDAAQTKYPNATITVKNYGGQGVSGTVSVYLFDVDGNVVALGQNGVTAGAGSTVTLTMVLTWTADKNVTHVSSGRVTIKE